MGDFNAPWHVIEDSQGFSNIHHCADPDEGDTGDIVATCFQDEAHCNLIAAAPELLAALSGLLSQVECGTALDCALCDAARVAIAKATGAS